MKKQLFAFILALGMSVALNAGQTYGQSNQAIRVEVPFEFTANNKTLPEGTYLINPANDGRVIWRIQSEHQKGGQFLLARNLSGARKYGDLRLTFHRYGSRHFLVSFKTPSYEVDLPTSGVEKGLRRSLKDLARVDVVTIKTVSQLSR